MFFGCLRASIGTVSVTTIRSISTHVGRSPSSASSEKSACVTKTLTSFAPCSFSAFAPAISVLPVIEDVVADDRRSCPRTRPVTSVTSTCSCAGRVLWMIAKLASIISAKRTVCFARPASGATATTSVAGEAEIAEVRCEQLQRSQVVDRDREEALDLPRVEVHRQHAVDAGELQHVGDETRRDRLARLRLAVLARVREPRDRPR